MSTHDPLSLPPVPQPPRDSVHGRGWGRQQGRGVARGAGRPGRTMNRGLEKPTRISNETSAGGLCVSVRGGVPYVALIARRNRAGKLEWCLPKGHLEQGESAVEAAGREIAEEAGVWGEPIQHLCTIDYWFSAPGTRIHKTVHHYLFEYVRGEITVENDPDKEAEKAAWISLTEAARILAYPNERRIVRIAIDLLYQEQ